MYSLPILLITLAIAVYALLDLHRQFEAKREAQRIYLASFIDDSLTRLISGSLSERIEISNRGFYLDDNFHPLDIEVDLNSVDELFEVMRIYYMKDEKDQSFKIITFDEVNFYEFYFVEEIPVLEKLETV